MVGIMDALSNEFYKMGTFSDDYYRDVITPYKEGVRGKPGFLQSMKNWQPWRAFMPQSMGGTFFTKPTAMASTALRGASRIPLAAFASDALAGTSLLSGGNREVRAGRDFTPSQPNSAVNEYAAGRGSQPTFSRPSANRDFTQTDYGKAYQRGGSVNPHEETARAAREWSPREQYISRSNQDRAYDATVNRFIQESQGDQQRWEQGGGQGAYPVFNEPGWESNVPMSPGWLQASSGRDNSGVMLALVNSPAVNKMKNIYNQVDPFFPDIDPIDQQIGYDFDKNLWGGTLGFGGEYDMEDDAYNAYINWGTNW